MASTEAGRLREPESVRDRRSRAISDLESLRARRLGFDLRDERFWGPNVFIRGMYYIAGTYVIRRRPALLALRKCRRRGYIRSQ